MSSSLDTLALRAKAGITDDAHDTALDALAAQWEPAIDHGLAPAFRDSDDPGIGATVTLGMLELVAGEYLAQLARAPGATDWVEIGDLKLRPPAGFDVLDPSGLKRQGLARLRPYLRSDIELAQTFGVRPGGGDKTWEP